MPIDKGISYCAFSVSGIHAYPPAVRPRRYPHGTRPRAGTDGDAGNAGTGRVELLQKRVEPTGFMRIVCTKKRFDRR